MISTQSCREPIGHASLESQFCCVQSRSIQGPARQLEGLSAPFARDLSGGPVPVTSDSEKISFNQINRKTGHRIRYMKVDADTGDEVES